MIFFGRMFDCSGILGYFLSFFLNFWVLLGGYKGRRCRVKSWNLVVVVFVRLSVVFFR